MKVERYRRQAHYRKLKGWWAGWKQTPPMPEALPKVGFVVPGLAAGFIYKTDSNVAMLEAFISNPKSKTDRRLAALDLISEALVKEGRRAGFSFLLAYSTLGTILRRAERYGFEVLNEQYSLAVKQL